MRLHSKKPLIDAKITFGFLQQSVDKCVELINPSLTFLFSPFPVLPSTDFFRQKKEEHENLMLSLGKS